MTDITDILGRPPIRKQISAIIEVTGPSFEDLCQPLSAKVLPASAMRSNSGKIMDSKSARVALRKRRAGGFRI